MRAFLASAVLVACSEPSAAGAPTVASTSRPVLVTALASTPLESHETPAAPEPAWRRLVLEERWLEAKAALDAESAEGRPQSPETRYLRARIAQKLSEPEHGLALLEGLAPELPLLSDDIARLRAELQLEVGPFGEAQKYFLAKGDDASLVMAARADERGGNYQQAFARVDGVVQRLGKRKERSAKDEALLVEAHAGRARLAGILKRRKAQVEALRWLCIEAVTSPLSADADEQLDALGTGRLTGPERQERALDLAKDGQLDRALREVSLAEKAPGPRQTAADLAHGRGWSYYYARQYREAAQELATAARLGAHFRVQDAFYSARAWSRAQEDDRAIADYRALIDANPGSRFAEDARYLIAHVEYARGRFKEADEAYGAYLKRHPGQSRFKAAVDHERAVTWLILGRYAEARGALRALFRAEASERRRALLEELHAFAAAGAGDIPAAEKHFHEVIEAYPLSFAALASRSRLRQLGLRAPPLIEPPGADPAPQPLEVRLPPRAELLHRLGLDGDAEEDVKTHANEITKAYAPRGGEALCMAYGKLETAAQRYRHAQWILKAGAVSRAPSPATRWAWECLYPKAFSASVEAAEEENALPPGVIHAVMRQESAFLHGAVSPVGARGLMQLMPATARRVAEEMGSEYDERLLTSPGISVRMGARYLARLLGRFEGRVDLAAAAYNAGPQAASRWLESGEQFPIDVFVARIPYAETRDYVQRVVGNLARYRMLGGGAEAVPELDLEIPRGLRALADDY